MINMIAKFMATVQPQESSRPVCSDDDGMLIDGVIRHYLKNIDENAWRVVFAYYVCKACQSNYVPVRGTATSLRLVEVELDGLLGQRTKGKRRSSMTS